MSCRAFIIGIENYASVKDGSIATSLPGTLKAAQDFRDWLVKKWTSEQKIAGSQIIFCSEPTEPGGRGAASEDVLTALLELKAAGQNATEELYFFFSGHGFSFADSGSRSDMLIASDFKSMALSGSACLNLDKTIYWLRQQLGPGLQYYFVDACRNVLGDRQIRPGGLLLPNDPQASGEASTFLMQSADPGATAAVDGAFVGTLLAGLHGKSTAKIWDETDQDAMMVRYDSLRGFMRKSLKAQNVWVTSQGVDGETDAVLARLKPAPPAKCTLKIEGVNPISGSVTWTGGRNGIPASMKLAGTTTEISLKPDRYRMTVQIDGADVSDGARDVTLYDDEELIFKTQPASATPGSKTTDDTAGQMAEIVIPEGSSIELHEIATGSRSTFRRFKRGVMPKGRYSAVLRDRDERVVKSTEIEIGSGEKPVIDIAAWGDSVPHASIARLLPNDGRSVDFSESLGGAVSDPDLDIWLAILGGGRILGTNVEYSKIGPFPLHDFSAAAPQSSAAYVLAGFEDPQTKLEVGVAVAGRPTVWQLPSSPPNLAGIRECHIPVASGPVLISLRVNDGFPYTLASFALPNRAMLITVTSDPELRLHISQYLLPVGHLINMLNPEVAWRVRSRNQLADVKRLAEFARSFRKRRDVWKDVSRDVLNEILIAKWLDPIVSAMAAYEMIRRGRTQEMAEVVQNMSTYFPDLPDTAALAVLFGQQGVPFNGTPLFLDGLKAFPGLEESLPLPSSQLDYNSPWTAWRGAVD